jgi:hypothetical protein
MTQWRNLATVVTDLIQLSQEYQHNYKGKCNVSVNKPTPGVFLHKGIPVGFEPTTETETLVFTLNYKANV